MEFSELLKNAECTWLDWKAAFPRSLSLGGKEREAGKGAFLKDLVSIANADDGRDTGFLVYGVKDHGTRRQVLGITLHLDDADIQQWARNSFDPPPTFVYSEIKAENEKETVAIIQIRRVPQYPHVCIQDLGGVLHKGQVWFRAGSQNTVAKREDLKKMFTGTAPMVFATMLDVELKKIQRYYESRGFRVMFPLVANRDSMQRQGALIAYEPGTRREIVVGRDPSNPDNVMMLKPRAILM